MTKYAAATAAPIMLPPAQRRILVPGQVEDDQSVRLGSAGVSGNLDLLRRARLAEPDAWIAYRPHPDVSSGLRKGFVEESEALRYADAVIATGAMPDLLDQVDGVHALTSLAGFEALLRGREVFTHGQPFYAGWGLTRDLGAPVARRRRRLSLPELVAGTLILYPRYLDPLTNLPCPPEILVRRHAETPRPRPQPAEPAAHHAGRGPTPRPPGRWSFRMTPRPASSFLFLQGPPGPFFAQLAMGLEAEGHRCSRVNFCGGDRLDWRRPAHDFTGSPQEWPDVLKALLEEDAVTDMVLFGDCRPLHAAAREVANDLRIAVHVFEEGYIRPDWVTLERGGVNGNSNLPRDPQVYLALAADQPPVPNLPPISASFRQRAVEALTYFAASSLLAHHYPHYRSHRPYRPAAEFAGWVVRFCARPLARLRSAITARRLRGHYFVLPLQLDSDHQIRTHSPFTGMTEAIERIISSFAAHAPKDLTLVVKEHPLDNGLKGWRRVVREIAHRHGASDRVLFFEHGHIDALVAAADGVVTVNSTTGTLALSAGTPVAVLGTAVYDLPGVTHQGPLDTFWTAPGKPQLEIYEAFRRVLVLRCLLRGGFSNRHARGHLVPSAVARLGQAAVAKAPTRSVKVTA